MNICKSRLVPNRIFTSVDWCLQYDGAYKYYKEFFFVFSQKGFHINLVFHVLKLIDIICEYFLMVDECL
jgi:hypothetical protein